MGGRGIKMHLKLKARWRLFRYHRELSKLHRMISGHQGACYKYRSKHCLDKDSRRRLLAPPHSSIMDMMLDKDKDMCANLDALIAVIKAFREEHKI